MSVLFRARTNTSFLKLESLILAQNERWRRVLGMQVERVQQCISGARVSNAWESAHHWGITFGNER